MLWGHLNTDKRANSRWYYQTHCIVIAETCQCKGEGEREGQREKFRNRYIFFHASGLKTGKNSHFALVFTLVCWQSGQFQICRRVTRRVHIRSRVRVGVFCPSSENQRDMWSVFPVLKPDCSDFISLKTREPENRRESRCVTSHVQKKDKKKNRKDQTIFVAMPSI